MQLNLNREACRNGRFKLRRRQQILFLPDIIADCFQIRQGRCVVQIIFRKGERIIKKCWHEVLTQDRADRTFVPHISNSSAVRNIGHGHIESFPGNLDLLFHVHSDLLWRRLEGVWKVCESLEIL